MKKLFIGTMLLTSGAYCMNPIANLVFTSEIPAGLVGEFGYARLDSAMIYLDSAQNFMEKGKHEDALNMFRRVAELYPENSDAYIGWLSACFGLGREEEGMQAIDQWIEHNPENTQAWLYKAFAEAGMKHPEKSLEAFDMLISLQPQEAGNYVGRGQMLYELGEYSAAVEAFDIALSLDPSRTDVSGMKASSLARLGKFDEALSIVNILLELSPRDPSAYYNRACIYSLKGEKANALTDLLRAIKIEPSFKEFARSDPDFKSLFNDDEFINLTN